MADIFPAENWGEITQQMWSNMDPTSPTALTGCNEKGAHFVWPGGNWGVTESLNTSALAAPFTVRCADGRALHPLQLRRRAKWYARSGRNQEEPWCFRILGITPPKFNMEPENDGFQKESPFPGTSFQVPC